LGRNPSGGEGDNIGGGRKRVRVLREVPSRREAQRGKKRSEREKSEARSRLIRGRKPSVWGHAGQGEGGKRKSQKRNRERLSLAGPQKIVIGTGDTGLLEKKSGEREGKKRCLNGGREAKKLEKGGNAVSTGGGRHSPYRGNSDAREGLTGRVGSLPFQGGTEELKGRLIELGKICPSESIDLRKNRIKR